MRNSLNHRLSIYYLVLVLVVAFVLFAHRKIAVNFTPSLRYTVFYLKNRQGGEIRRGDYVLFTVDHPLIRDVINEVKIETLIKESVCIGGDVLTVSHKDYYCNGGYLGTAKDYSFKGERVDNFKYNGLVPLGSLFVMGHNKDSFDSRYFGFIRVGDVEKIARPLI
jgi:conjugative transfer signal peptidase TraF